MDWLLGKREKSVARNAQLAVKNMHMYMDKQGAKIRELEGLVVGMQQLCTESLESEIHRLETKKLDLVRELEATNLAITEKVQKLEETKGSVKMIISQSTERARAPPTKSKKVSDPMSGGARLSDTLAAARPHQKHTDVSSPTVSAAATTPKAASSLTSLSDQYDVDYLEEEFLEEIEMLSTIREVLSPATFLFVLHRNNSDDAIVYSPSAKAEEVISTSKLTDFSDKSSVTALSSFDFILGLGTKIVPNHGE
jgi:hypothetical protein